MRILSLPHINHLDGRRDLLFDPGSPVVVETGECRPLSFWRRPRPCRVMARPTHDLVAPKLVTMQTDPRTLSDKTTTVLPPTRRFDNIGTLNSGGR
jgi:hypothetical protein